MFSVYLLTSTTTVPVYGKLADIYGRKPVFLAGLGLFFVGTLLCGAAGSMVQLVAFRAVQGIGAGAVLPLTLTVLGDIYTTEERAKVQPATASVWGVLSLVGPTAGALITTALSWRWVFWSNAPLCVVTMVMLALFFQERIERKQVAVDYAGAATLTLALVALLLAMLRGGQAISWNSWQMAALLATAAVLFAAFALVERRAKDPVVPFAAFRLRVVAVSSAGNLLMGACMYGLTSFVPLFAQGVLGRSAVGASAVLTPLQVAWSVSALLSGRLYLRIGFRNAALFGTALIALGIGPLVLLEPDTPLLVAGIGMGITGAGFGISNPAFLLAVQSAVPWNLRGAVTSSTQFFRTIGGSVGVALLGALLNARLITAAPELGRQAGTTESLVSAMLTPEARAALAPELVETLRLAIAGGLHWIYVVLFVLAAVGLLQVGLFAHGRRQV
ncbi:MAG: MFS transporter [Chloroflexi bacterium]|nr:MFS transporter [Chloroflexota bacterium]